MYSLKDRLLLAWTFFFLNWLRSQLGTVLFTVGFKISSVIGPLCVSKEYCKTLVGDVNKGILSAETQEDSSFYLFCTYDLLTVSEELRRHVLQQQSNTIN